MERIEQFLSEGFLNMDNRVGAIYLPLLLGMFLLVSTLVRMYTAGADFSVGGLAVFDPLVVSIGVAWLIIGGILLAAQVATHVTARHAKRHF